MSCFTPVVRLLVSLTVLVALGACDDTGPEANPGMLTGVLVSPTGDEGAAVIRLLGPVMEVTSVDDTEAFAAHSQDVTHVVLVSQPGGRLQFGLRVPDVGTPPLAFVREVAGPEDQARTSVAEYRVEFLR